MEQPPEHPQPPRRITLRADRLARLALAGTLVLCGVLAIAPTRDYLAATDRAAKVRHERERLQREDRVLGQRVRELSRGSGLEEEARRQGLISAAERSYVVEDLPEP